MNPNPCGLWNALVWKRVILLSSSIASVSFYTGPQAISFKRRTEIKRYKRHSRELRERRKSVSSTAKISITESAATSTKIPSSAANVHKRRKVEKHEGCLSTATEFLNWKGAWQLDVAILILRRISERKHQNIQWREKVRKWQAFVQVTNYPSKERNLFYKWKDARGHIFLPWHERSRAFKTNCISHIQAYD